MCTVELRRALLLSPCQVLSCKKRCEFMSVRQEIINTRMRQKLQQMGKNIKTVKLAALTCAATLTCAHGLHQPVDSAEWLPGIPDV